jgi:hypothetical protein
MAHACQTWTTSSRKYSSQDGDGPGYCTWIPEVKRLHSELETNGLDHVRIMGPEEMTVGHDDDIWKTWFQMKYVKDIYSDAAMMNILDIWCHHDYSREDPSPAAGNRTVQGRVWQGHSDDNQPALNWDGYSDHPRPVWMTEGETADNTWDGAMEFANYIQDALIAGNVSAYIPWALGADALDDKHAVTVYSGGIETHHRIPTYAFKHFSRYIRPGAVRYAVSPDNPSGITASAYIHASNATLTLVALNNASSSETLRLSIPGNLTIADFSVFTSKDGSYWKESSATVSGSGVTVTVPGRGIVTLYGEATGGMTGAAPRSAQPHPLTGKQDGAARERIEQYSIRGRRIGHTATVSSGIVIRRARSRGRVSVHLAE